MKQCKCVIWISPFKYEDSKTGVFDFKVSSSWVINTKTAIFEQKCVISILYSKLKSKQCVCQINVDLQIFPDQFWLAMLNYVLLSYKQKKLTCVFKKKTQDTRKQMILLVMFCRWTMFYIDWKKMFSIFKVWQ